MVIMDRLKKGWPEDDWFSVSADWDLNLYESGGLKYANLYPVVNGNTDLSREYPLRSKYMKS